MSPRRRLPKPAPADRPTGPGEAPPESEPLEGEAAALLALQQMAGNRAVGGLLRRGGGRLPDQTRQVMEARLGEDFSAVQVHTDEQTAAAADLMGAKAFTAGPAIGFAAGSYAPGTPEGDTLLAHELAHVAQQQRTGQPADPRQVTPRGDPSERQAAAAARGESTALDAAPVGVALAGPEPDVAEPTVAQGLAPAAEPADPGAALDRNIGLADTIARGYLDRHYNDVQDALRDFKESAAVQIAAMPGAPSGLWGLLPTLVDTVNTVVSEKFPIGRIGKTVTKVISETAPLRSTAQTLLTTSATNARDAAKDKATAAIGDFAGYAGSTQAAAFRRGREALRDQLYELAGSPGEARSLLEMGSTAAVVSEYLGIPSPDDESLYRPIRLGLELKFADWLTDEEYLAKDEWWVKLGLNEAVYKPRRNEARQRVEKDVEARQGSSLGAGLDAALDEAYTFEDQETDPVLAGPEIETMGLDYEAETDAIVLESVKLAEIRARTFMNMNYNAVQDALRDFTTSAQNQIENMEAEPTDYGLYHTLFDTALAAVGIVFPPSALAITIFAALKTGVQTFAAEAEAQAKENRKQQAQDTVGRFARGMSNAQASAFADGERNLGALLTELALTDDTARRLLEQASPEALDRVINSSLGVPNPETSGAYLKVREPLEVKFSEWYTVETKVDPKFQQYGAAEWLLKPAREEARERARADAQARSAMGLMIEPEDEEPELPLTPMGPLTLEDSRKATALNQAIALIDTRARGFLNTHYDSVQDAIRDFEESAQERLNLMDGPPADLSSLHSTLFSTAAGKVAGAFTEDYVGDKLSKALGTAASVGPATQSYLMAESAKADSSQVSIMKGAGKQMMQSLTKDMSNFQAAAFERGHQSIGRELTRLIATDAGLRARLEAFADQSESGMRLDVDDVITGHLGIPNPETSPMYLKVRTALETEFFGWAARVTTQARLDEHAWTYLYDIDPEIEKRSRAEAEKRAREAAKQRGEG